MQRMMSSIVYMCYVCGRVGWCPGTIRFLSRCATDSCSTWAFFIGYISLPYTMTDNTCLSCTLLFIFLPAFMFFVMLATLLNAAHSSAMCRLDSRKEISNSCHHLTKVHVSVWLFNDISVYGDRVRGAIFIEHHLGLIRAYTQNYVMCYRESKQ